MRANNKEQENSSFLPLFHRQKKNKTKKKIKETQIRN